MIKRLNQREQERPLVEPLDGRVEVGLERLEVRVVEDNLLACRGVAHPTQARRLHRRDEGLAVSLQREPRVVRQDLGRVRGGDVGVLAEEAVGGEQFAVRGRGLVLVEVVEEVAAGEVVAGGG
ncbi:hypothetical protein PG995_014478 [Apiospora arundinis]